MGKPPFETSCLKETYNRIKKNSYTIPWVRWLACISANSMRIIYFLQTPLNLDFQLSLQHINPAATSLIKKMLHADPTQRPTISDVQADEFFTSGYVPSRLPTTCLTVPPRFSMGPSAAVELNQRRPLTAINNKGNDLQTLNVSRYSESTGFNGEALLSSRYREGGCEGGAHAKVRDLLNSLPLIIPASIFASVNQGFLNKEVFFFSLQGARASRKPPEGNVAAAERSHCSQTLREGRRLPR